MRKLLHLAFAFAIAGLAGSAGAQPVTANCPIEGPGATSWSGEIIIEQACFVRNGGRLNISPGTIVRGQPRTALAVQNETNGVPGALIVTQTGIINAQGTASNPIVMTTAAVDNDNDNVPDDLDGDGYLDPYPGFDPADCPGACTNPGLAIFYDDAPKTAPLAPLDANGNGNLSLWGGVAILGNAPTNLQNKCGVGYGQCTIEGLTFPGYSAEDAKYGGSDPHDYSGIMKYVSVRHAGDKIDDDNELNCISLGGVGDGTILDYIECYVNFDDGFEWFGGTVDSSHLVASMIGDDTFDMDQGFTGFNQFWLGIMPFFDEIPSGTFGSKSGDKAGEWDGDDFAERSEDVNLRRGTNDPVEEDTPWPLQGPAIWNMTMIGSTPDATPAPCFAQTNADNQGIQMRNGFAGRLYNSVITNAGGDNPDPLKPDYTSLECIIGDGSILGHDCPDHATAGLVSAMCVTIDKEAPGTLAPDATVLANGDAMAVPMGCPNATNLVNGAWPDYEQPDYTFNPQGDANGKLNASLKASCGGPFNPRFKFGFVGVAGCCAPQGIGADSSATYRGAFDKTKPELWTKGWTALNVGGILAD
jgi:hypothetical protein